MRYVASVRTIIIITYHCSSRTVSTDDDIKTVGAWSCGGHIRTRRVSGHRSPGEDDGQREGGDDDARREEDAELPGEENTGRQNYETQICMPVRTRTPTVSFCDHGAGNWHEKWNLRRANLDRYLVKVAGH